MSRIWLTRRASPTASREQHLFSAICSTPSSMAAAGSDQRRSIMPITSWPCSLSSAAATELSTPPLMATTILAICVTVLHSSDQKAPHATPLPPLTPKLQALHILAHPLFSGALKSRALLRYGETRSTDLACRRSPRTYSTAPGAALLHHRFPWSLQNSLCILQVVIFWILDAYAHSCRE